MKKDSCEFCAVRDVAVEMPDGLADIDDLGLAKMLLRRIAPRLSYAQMLERVGNSVYPAELLDYLPHIYGTTVAELRPIATALFEHRSCFESDQLFAFADRYWPAAQKERSGAGDHAGAWTITKMACLGIECLQKGIVDWVLPGIVKHEPAGLLVSVDCGRRMVQDLHAVMTMQSVIPDFLEQPRSTLWGDKLWPAGIGVAKAIGGYDPDGDPQFTTFGLQALAIGKFAATQSSMLAAA